MGVGIVGQMNDWDTKNFDWVGDVCALGIVGWVDEKRESAARFGIASSEMQAGGQPVASA